MKIKIIGQSKGEPVLHIDGLSGRLYKFHWDSPEGAYTHTPQNQEEADDIFQNQNIDGLWFYSAIMGEHDATTPAPEPTLPREYYAELEAPELLKLCADCGVKVSGSDERKTMIRLLEAFYTGQGVEVPKREDTGEWKPSPENDGTVTGSTETEPDPEPAEEKPPEPAEAPKKRGRGRPKGSGKKKQENPEPVTGPPENTAAPEAESGGLPEFEE